MRARVIGVICLLIGVAIGFAMGGANDAEYLLVASGAAAAIAAMRIFDRALLPRRGSAASKHWHDSLRSFPALPISEWK